MKTIRTILIAACIAAVTEAILFALWETFGRIGAEGPANAMGWVGLILHLPGIFVADRLRLTGADDVMVIAFIGFLQYFLALWAVISIWNRTRLRTRQ